MSDFGTLLAFARGEGEEPVTLTHPEIEMERRRKEREDWAKGQAGTPREPGEGDDGRERGDEHPDRATPRPASPTPAPHPQPPPKPAASASEKK